MSKERPILFSGDMVKAILDGRKTQTRRVMKPQPVFHPEAEDAWVGVMIPSYWTWLRSSAHNIVLNGNAPYQPDILEWCPYGKTGDRLWVREAWTWDKDCLVGIEQKYKADYFPIPNSVDERKQKYIQGLRWTPSIHMPRWASRILLEVTGVRVERVQDITEADAKAEGYPVGCEMSPIDWFMTLWDSINAKRGYGWNQNPFNWVVDYKRIANEETAAAEAVAQEQ